MQGNKKEKYLVPAIYTVPWAIGLLNSVFCFVSADSEPTRKIIAAFSVYSVFFINTIIDIFLFYVKALQRHVRPIFAFILLIITILLVVAIAFAKSFQSNGNLGMIIGVIITILCSYYFMAVIKRNPDLCFTTPVKKTTVKSHLR